MSIFLSAEMSIHTFSKSAEMSLTRKDVIF